jgi:phosphodiesterase/alkaline phosphatase D-like protein
MQRRAFNQHLQRSAIALALSPWLTAVAAPTDKPRAWRVNPFALGVASGRPRADSVVLWTRVLFSEEDRALGTEADGSGLGLPIVLEIAHQHAAVVTLEDAAPGKPMPGARFTVRFSNTQA